MTLRIKTSLLLATVVTVALTVSGVFFLELLESSLEKSVYAGLESVSSTSAEAVTKVLNDTLREAQAVALALPKEAIKEKNVPMIEETLKALLEVFPRFQNGMFLLDGEGELWVDYPSHPDLRGSSLAFREYFHRTMNEGSGVISAPYRSVRTEHPVVTFTSPLRGGGGQLVGVLGCSLTLLTPDALEGIRKTKIGESGYLYVFDTTGLMILHPQDNRVYQRDVPPGVNKLWDAAIEGFEGVGETVNSRGIPMLLSIKHIRGTNWILVAQQPRSEAYAPIKEARDELLFSILIGILVAVLIGGVSVRRITAPLEKLRNAALHFGHGAGLGGDVIEGAKKDINEELEAIRAGDEIGDLVHAFTDMSKRLDETLGSLKKSATDWERTFDSVSDAIFILDREHRILRHNRMAGHREFSASLREFGLP